MTLAYSFSTSEPRFKGEGVGSHPSLQGLHHFVMLKGHKGPKQIPVFSTVVNVTKWFLQNNMKTIPEKFHIF